MNLLEERRIKNEKGTNDKGIKSKVLILNSDNLRRKEVKFERIKTRGLWKINKKLQTKEQTKVGIEPMK